GRVRAGAGRRRAVLRGWRGGPAVAHRVRDRVRHRRAAEPAAPVAVRGRRAAAVRAALARRATRTPPTRAGLAAGASAVASLAGLAGFVLGFLSAYFTDAPTRALPHFPEGTPEHAAVEVPASWGLASYLVTSLVLAVPLAWLILRWRLPFGAVPGYAAGLA